MLLFFMLARVLICALVSAPVCLVASVFMESLGREMHVTFQSQHTVLGAREDLFHQLLFHSA